MVSPSGMNNDRLAVLLHQALPHLEGEAGFWGARIDEDLDIYVLTDELEDRIRIQIPVAEARRDDNDLLWVLLLANFELAQDAKYAVHEGVVWCKLKIETWMTK